MLSKTKFSVFKEFSNGKTLESQLVFKPQQFGLLPKASIVYGFQLTNSFEALTKFSAAQNYIEFVNDLTYHFKLKWIDSFLTCSLAVIFEFLFLKILTSFILKFFLPN